MTARPVKRSLTLRGHRTSVSLEEPFWVAFRQIAAERGQPLAALAAEIDEARGDAAGLASAIRVFVLEHLRGTAPRELPAGVVEILDPSERSALVAQVLASLPDWFGRPEANARHAAGAAEHVTFAAIEDGAAVAVLTRAVPTGDAAEIDVMGVMPDAQARGHGSRLVAAAAHRARGAGRRLLTARTVSPQVDDATYARTRRFYARAGFLAAAELPPAPDLSVAGTFYARPI